MNTGLFLSFFYHLRAKGLKVTPTQWMDLVRGLCLGLHGSSLMGFYSLARSILVKDESELDDFDVAFAEHFEGVESVLPKIEDDIRQWLETPIDPYPIDPALQKVMDEVDVEALRKELEERLKEQKERHDGGSKWVGTGGTSPFGHSGYHPGGIRIGGERRLGSAVQVAAARRFKEHRKDLILDTRQFGMALKKMRAFSREGTKDELDIDETIDKTAKQGGEIDLVFTAPKTNNITLLLAMDVGGSMESFRRLTDLLFSAAFNARHFKRFEHVYFHNCIYEAVYADSYFSEPILLRELFSRFDRETRLVMVGDAYMYPGELTNRYGSLNWYERNERPGAAYLLDLAEHFRRAAWLNPMDERWWGAPSINMVSRIFPMYPLTISGVERLAADLA